MFGMTEKRSTGLYELPREYSGVPQLLEQFLAEIPNLETPFIMVDLDELVEPKKQWQRILPSVFPYFARKSQGHHFVLRELVGPDCGLDCAGGGEIEDTLSGRISLARTIVTNPVRDETDLKALVKTKPEAIVVHAPEGVRELGRYGIPNKEYSPILYARLALAVSGIRKYGADCLEPLLKDGRPTSEIFDDDLAAIFEAANEVEKQQGAQFAARGLAGHMGSDNPDVKAWRFMLRLMKFISQEGLAKRGMHVTHFNLGGGYIGSSQARALGVDVNQYLTTLAHYIAEFREGFPYPVTVVAEPGRFFVSRGFVGVSRVTDVQYRSNDQVAPFTFVNRAHLQVYTDDSVYKSMMNSMVEKRLYETGYYRHGKGLPLARATAYGEMYGATCAGEDKWRLIRGERVPANIRKGDYCFNTDMGPYSTETATNFNRTKPLTIVAYRRSDIHKVVWLHGALDGTVLSGSEGKAIAL